MSPPKFLADEHIDLAAARALKKEVDIASVQEVGIRRKDDKILIKYAREENRAIITKDTDFLKEDKKGNRLTRIRRHTIRQITRKTSPPNSEAKPIERRSPARAEVLLEEHFSIGRHITENGFLTLSLPLLQRQS